MFNNTYKNITITITIITITTIIMTIMIIKQIVNYRKIIAYKINVVVVVVC